MNTTAFVISPKKGIENELERHVNPNPPYEPVGRPTTTRRNKEVQEMRKLPEAINEMQKQKSINHETILIFESFTKILRLLLSEETGSLDGNANRQIQELISTLQEEAQHFYEGEKS